MADAQSPGSRAIYFNRQAMVRLEPNAVVINDADDRNRNIKSSRCNCRDPVKSAVRWGVQNIVTPYSFDALGFVLRDDHGEKQRSRRCPIQFGPRAHVV